MSKRTAGDAGLEQLDASKKAAKGECLFAMLSVTRQLWLCRADSPFVRLAATQRGIPVPVMPWPTTSYQGTLSWCFLPVAVAEHYGTRVNQSARERKNSPIYALRVLNNWASR